MSVEGLAALIIAITGLVAALGGIGLHVNLRAKVNAIPTPPTTPVTVNSSQETHQ
jgi:hypothetical protein